MGPSLRPLIAPSRWTTSRGLALSRRERPEPFWVLTELPTLAAKRSTRRDPRAVVPRWLPAAASRFSSISAKKSFDGVLVAAISVDTGGEATPPSGGLFRTVAERAPTFVGPFTL